MAEGGNKKHQQNFDQIREKQYIHLFLIGFTSHACSFVLFPESRCAQKFCLIPNSSQEGARGESRASGRLEASAGRGARGEGPRDFFSSRLKYKLIYFLIVVQDDVDLQSESGCALFDNYGVGY